jgi:pilus assembly protein CpaB
MKARTVLTLLVSLGIAGLAALIANTWISQRLGAAEATEELAQVVSAAVDIPVGTRIEATHVRVLALPASAVTSGSITGLDEALGRVAVQPLYAGEILLQKRLAEYAGGGALAAVIEPGKRAVTVRVNDVIGVAGFLAPGSRVDVVATRRAAEGHSNMSKTLVENLKVLAVDQTVSTDKNDPVVVRAVTLEVSPKEAEQLVKATEEGKVQLTLRNPLDVAVTPPPAPELAAVPPPPEPAAKPAPRWSGYRVDVIRGTEVSRTSVTGGGGQ